MVHTNSVEASLTCYAATIWHFSSAAATSDPLARLFALRSSPPRSLLNGRDGLGREELVLDAGYFEVMVQIVCHLLPVDSLQVCLGHDPGSQGKRRAVLQGVEEIILPGEDHGQMWF